MPGRLSKRGGGRKKNKGASGLGKALWVRVQAHMHTECIPGWVTAFVCVMMCVMVCVCVCVCVCV